MLCLPLSIETVRQLGSAVKAVVVSVVFADSAVAEILDVLDLVGSVVVEMTVVSVLADLVVEVGFGLVNGVDRRRLIEATVTIDVID